MSDNKKNGFMPGWPPFAEFKREISNLVDLKVLPIKKDQEVIKEALLNHITETNDKIDSVKEDISGVKKDISGVKQDISGVKQDISGVKQDISGVKQDISGIKEDISGIKKAVLSK